MLEVLAERLSEDYNHDCREYLGDSLYIFLEELRLGQHEESESQSEENLPALAEKTVEYSGEIMKEEDCNCGSGVYSPAGE